ncbi:MAG: SDR family oxidoreductase [Candidatus Lokiarchaeota archaeon]|nr:SDR family oxidoreductase [Candidatus Lokiarchaeota archaeon]
MRRGINLKTGLKGKHAVITGAASGIGFETTKRLLAEGVNITGTYHSSKKGLEELIEHWQDHLQIIQADVRDEASVQNLFRLANKAFGRVDISIANAGIANHEGVAIQDMTLEQWDRIISVNLTGVFLTAKYFFKNLETYPEEQASLILIGSTAGIFGEAWYCDYASTKAGLKGLMLSLKNEIVHLARKGRVNIVNPGWTVTPMAEEALTEEESVTRILQTLPMRKVALPKDIANAILYLASDELAGHVSGQSITVAGGMEGRLLFVPSDIDPSRARG